MPGPNVRTGLLEVFLLGRKTGELRYSSHRNEMRFQYDEAYLTDADAIPLSHALPLRKDPFDSDGTTVFFENLLPPDQVRRKLGPVLHISRHNIFGFLEAIGGDCAGAISLWPKGGVPDAASESFKAEIERTAQAILDARQKYAGASFAELYGEKMYLFADLVAAHEANDAAVLKAYGWPPDLTAPEIVKMYAKKLSKCRHLII